MGKRKLKDPVQAAEEMVGADNVSVELANELRAVHSLVRCYNGEYSLRSASVIASIIINHQERKKEMENMKNHISDKLKFEGIEGLMR